MSETVAFPGGSRLNLKPGPSGDLDIQIHLMESDPPEQVLQGLKSHLQAFGIDLQDIIPIDSSVEAKPDISIAGMVGSGQVLLGANDRGRKFYDPPNLTNGHISVIGATGYGKTTLLVNMIRQLYGIIIVIDPSGDMHVPGERVYEFQRESNWGINPMAVGVDVENGGPQIQTLVLLEFFQHQQKQSGTTFGIRQQDVTRRLLQCVYQIYGITESPDTWTKPQPRMKALVELVCHLVDLHQAGYFGWVKRVQKIRESLEIAKAHLERMYEAREEYQAFQAEREKRKEERGEDAPEEGDELASPEINGFLLLSRDDVEKLKKKISWMESEERTLSEWIDEKRKLTIHIDGVHADFAETIDRFTDASDQLLGIRAMLESLDASGIFGPDIVRISEPGVYRFEVRHLETGPRHLLVETLMRDIFRQSVKKGFDGWTDRTFLFHDEAKDQLARSKHDDNAIAARIANQGRKYGLCYICVGQNEKMIPPDMRNAFFTKIIMGCGSDPNTIKGVSKAYNIPESEVRSLQRGEAMITQGGEPFQKFALPEPLDE